MTAHGLKLLTRLMRRTTHNKGGVRRRLISQARFRRVLESERGRTDRTGIGFSLVTFSPRDPATATATVERVVTFLRGRLRLPDEIGWFTDRDIAAVLPATTASGAWVVADEVCVSFPADMLPPLCTVYGYPSDWSKEGDISYNKIHETPHEHKPVHAMERVFMKPLPGGKRCVDFIVSAVGLIVCSPLFVIIALAIKATSRGSVLFSQRRVGLGGQVFTMYKFRSMVMDAESHRLYLAGLNERDGPVFKIKDDPRLTPIGRLLRCTSIDELPQLWNVLRGDMTLVGPRPPIVNEVLEYAYWHRRRLDVTPGITCIWQVSGRSGVDFPTWVRMDLEYIRKRSFLHDLKLLVWTVPAVLSRKGAD
jgi:lipopolysaccharide/colanic/teichoic acid biosynthesis glycosyltransferase